jgi:hypothetical protein
MKPTATHALLFVVTDEWSLGALARLTAYRLFDVDDEIRLLSPSLLLTATFN